MAQSIDINAVGSEVISNQIKPRSLFCPFCADEYMFEFSLKDHLKRKHTNELVKKCENDLPESEQVHEDYLCPYCDAIFYSKTIIPKHIFHHHGRNWLHHYQQNYYLECTVDKENDDAGTYAVRSPGLSDIFEKLMGKNLCSANNTVNSITTDAPKLKSILKKTPNKMYNPILGSPSSASIRRYRNELVKRSLSARRELRFDLPATEKSPTQVVRKHKKFLDLLRLFKFRKSSNKTIKNSPIKKLRKKTDNYINLQISKDTMKKNMITNFLDYDTFDDSLDAVDTCENNSFNIKKSDQKYKSKRKIEICKNQPLLFSAERFQCGCCDEKYISNTDLLIHLKEKHYKRKCFLKKHYKCGQCEEKFFKNHYLIRHSFIHSTSEKI